MPLSMLRLPSRALRVHLGRTTTSPVWKSNLITQHRHFSTTVLAASNDEPAKQQQKAQIDSSEQVEPNASAGSAQEVQEQAATTSTSEADIPVVEATNIIDPNDRGVYEGDDYGIRTAMLPLVHTGLQGVIPIVPDAVAERIGGTYLGMAALFLVQGIFFTFAAANNPEMLVPTKAAGALGATMLGCAAAAAFQASGLVLHLKAGGPLELGLWKHQRILAAVTLYSAITAVSSIAGLAAGAPLLCAILAVVSLLTAAGGAMSMRSCWSHGPWVQSTIQDGDVMGTMQTLWQYLSRDLGTIAGIVLLAWMGISVFGSVGILLDPASWDLRSVGSNTANFMLHHFYPYATAPSEAGALDVLRRMCGAGMILSATAAHTLLEGAGTLRHAPFMEWLKTNLANSLKSDDDQVHDLINPPQDRFIILSTLAVFVACAVQAYFLWQAPAAGVNVNMDAAFMAPLHWTAMCGALYLLTGLFQIDWSSVQNVFLSVFLFFGSIVAFVSNRFLVKPDWTVDHKL